MIKPSNNLKQAGIAHAFLIIAAVIGLVGVLGFVGYSAWQKQSANAGGSNTVGTPQISWEAKCGAGYKFISKDSKSFGTLRVFGKYDSKLNHFCAILHKTGKYYGVASLMQVNLGKATQKGNYMYYAGPIYVDAAKTPRATPSVSGAITVGTTVQKFQTYVGGV